MKKYLFSIALLLSLVAKSQTSIYHPFPDSNAVWCDVEVRHVCPMVQPDILRKTTYQLDGKMQIDSFIYNRLDRYQVAIIYDFCTTPITYIDTTPYYLRQDTLLKKIYRYNFSTQRDTILYDFNLQVGDTLTNARIIWGSDSLNQFPFIVTGIDSIMINGSYRKKFVVQNNDSIGPCPYNSTSIIEGIGSVNGLIYPPSCFEYSAQLNEFIQDDQVVFGDTSHFFVLMNCPNYSLPNVMRSIASGNIYASIFPNPFHSSAVVQTSPGFEIAELKIYNNLGILIGQEKISTPGKLMLKRDELMNGIYFLQLINRQGEMITQKFVIE